MESNCKQQKVCMNIEIILYFLSVFRSPGQYSLKETTKELETTKSFFGCVGLYASLPWLIPQMVGAEFILEIA